MNGLNEVVGGCRLSFINIGDGGGGYGKFVGKLHLREMKVLHDLSYAVFHAGVIFLREMGGRLLRGRVVRKRGRRHRWDRGRLSRSAPELGG